MKIICIGNNYAEHIKELNNETPEEPTFFIKPETSLLFNNRPFFLPDFSKEIHHEIELVIKICRLGKNIQEKFANTYYNEIGLGIDFTARDLQRKCKTKGLPWEIAKAFDQAAPVSKFVKKNTFRDMLNINFYLAINGKIVQKGNSENMIFSFDKIISYVSRFITLKIGDLIFTGTPSGVGVVNIDDHIEAYLEKEKLLDFNIK